MPASDADRVQNLFSEALQQPADERVAFVQQQCGDDAALCAQVVDLLGALDDAGVFMSDPTDGAAAPAADGGATRQAVPREQPGDRIGRYKLLQPIGEGGFGSIWMAEQKEPVRRRVALKIIKLGMDTRQVIARFEAERQALAMMDHPHIAKVLDAGATETGRPYFVMEYIRGVPILEYCDTEKLDTTARLGLFTSVCHAIQHAHQKGIIHRDIKPSNVLVTMHDGVPVPKVIDFGIAKATNTELTQKTLFTAHRQMVGTPAYMSPEQAEMSGLDIDTRSDIYSLGVLLYELLTGTTPFDSKSLMEAGFAEMMRIIREEEPHKPSTRLSSLGESGTHTARQRRVDLGKLQSILRGDLDWIVMKCLEKNRTRRYETANGLAADIRRHLDDEPVVAGPPGAGYRLRKFVRRNRASVLAGTAIGAVLVLGLAGTTYGLIKANEQRKLASQRADEADAARAEEAKRAEELQLVADFHSEQFGAVVPELMGARLRDAIVDAAPDEQQAELRTTLDRINFTNIGLESLETNIFDPTREAIDEQFDDQPLVQAQLLQALAESLRRLGLLDAAMQPQHRALSIRRETLGDDDVRTLESMDSMGQLLWVRGELGAAESYFLEALDGRRRVLGDDHMDTLDSISNLGTLLGFDGRLDEANVYYRQALEGRRRVLGDDHTSTLGSFNNMGWLLQTQGKLDAAEPYYREALEGHRRVLGDDHPHTLNSIANMGFLLTAQGRHGAAEPYTREALEGRRRVLGDDHSATFVSLNNMGAVLQAQGKLDEAEPYYREVLDACRRVLGDDHPITVISLNNLGGLLNETTRHADGEPLMRESVEIGTRVLGAHHWRVAEARSLLGEALAGLGSYDEAEPLLLDSHAALDASLPGGRRARKLPEAARRIVALYELWGKPEQADAWRERAAVSTP